MIYNKDAAFSYPVLSDTNSSYKNSGIHLSINNITDLPASYKLSLEYEVESQFVQNLLNRNKAALIFIVQSEDNLFYELDNNQKSLTISKSRITFGNKVRAQLHIQSKEDIHFSDCQELNSFYNSIKKQLSIPKNSLIGYSNVSTVRNSGREGVALFEKSVDPKMELDFQVILSNKSILLKFKEEKHLLQTTARNRNVMNIYLYNGLEKALNQFIGEQMQDGEESLFLDDIDDSSLNDLHYKLYKLLSKKGVNEISSDLIDTLVQKIAPKIIGNFTQSIERLNDNGN